MTRLQHLLSQIKTVEELAEILGVTQFDVYKHIAVSKDREQLIPCKVGDCEKCALYNGGRCTSRYESMVKYFNAEISHTPSTVIIAMRDRAIERLKRRYDIARNEKVNSYLTATLLDMLCDMLEDIGLFEPNECHDMLIKAIEEKTKK